MAETVPEMTPRQLADLVSAGGPVVLLDVREPAERNVGAIPVGTAVHDLHVPLGKVATALETIRAATAGKRLVVYCHHGVRSAAAVGWLLSQGLDDVMNLRGGIDAWSLEVDPRLPRY